MAILPFILLLIFGFFWFRDRARGGYKAESLPSQGTAQQTQTPVPGG
jgi:ATP-dependent Zn protease